VLDYDKDNYQISFNYYLKYQPSQHLTAELVIATDKLVIAYLLMKGLIGFYEKKSISVEIIDRNPVINDAVL